MNILKRLFPPASKEKFASRIIAELRRAGIDGSIDFDSSRFLLRYGKEGQQIIYLGNMYAEYIAAPISERRAVIKRFLSAFTGQPVQQDSLAQVKHRLLPRVRERFYYDAFELNMLIDRANHPPVNPAKPPLEDFINRPLNEELVVELVMDLPDAIRSISKRDLAKWSVTFDDAMSIAKENLWQVSKQDFKRIRPGLFVAPWNDTHDASRMFLHDLIWQLPVTGDHVVAIPNRNALLVTGSNDDENLVAVAKMVDEIMQQPRTITGQIFRLQETKWKPFVPPSDFRAHLPVKQVAMKSIANDYAEQKGLLESLHQKMGMDIFVAAQGLMKRDDQSLWTWTYWINGITHALIPEAEFIAFGTVNDDGSSKQAGFARWAQVVEKVGHLMEATSHYPPRYRIREYPSDEQLDQLELFRTPPNDPAELPV